MKKKPQKPQFDPKALMMIKASGSRYIKWILLAAVLLVIGVVLEIISPTFLGHFTDEIADHAATRNISMETLGKFGLILVVLYGLHALLTYWASFIISTNVHRYSRDLRKSINDKIGKLPLSYLDKNSSGDTMSRVTNDIDSLSENLDQSISTVVRSVFMLLGSLIAMFITCWQLALVAIGTLPLVFLFIVFDMKLAMPHFRRRQKQMGELTGVIEENFSGSVLIRLFRAEKKKNALFEEKNKRLGGTMFKAQTIGGLIGPILNFISYAAYAAVMLVGGLLMASGKGGVTFGTITSFIIYVRLFQSPLTEIGQAFNMLQSISAAATRVFEFIGAPEMADESSKDAHLPEKIQGSVDFDHVHFSYDPGKEIIHDFSASVKPGMKIAIVGPTGAGKTTLVNLLMRFYEVDSGSISIDGVQTSSLKREEVHEAFGMVLQDTWIFEGTVRENIVYNTPDVSDERLWEVIKEANLEYFVKTLPGELDYLISDRSSISGGQRQMITIARAMLRNAPLLILDEATSNVDTRTEELIQEAMDRLMAGRTSFVVAHRLSTIRNADLILVMKDGNIIEQGNHDSLMKENGFYAALYNSQFAFE